MSTFPQSQSHYPWSLMDCGGVQTFTLSSHAEVGISLYIPHLFFLSILLLYQSKLYAPTRVSKAPFIFYPQDNSKMAPGTDVYSTTVSYSLRRYFHLLSNSIFHYNGFLINNIYYLFLGCSWSSLL